MPCHQLQGQSLSHVHKLLMKIVEVQQSTSNTNRVDFEVGLGCPFLPDPMIDHLYDLI